MPELPEVETIKRGLEKFITNAKITDLEVFCEKSFIGPDSAPQSAASSTSQKIQLPAARQLVVGQIITGVSRRGKALLVHLANSLTLMIHLRMTGQLIYRSSQDSFAGGHPSDNFVAELPNKQTRVVFTLDGGSKLFFNDQRKFGFVKLLPTAEIAEDPFIKKLAKEPWDISVSEFADHLRRHKNSCIKATILDQSVVAGVGNIYADEALFASRIHPSRLAGSLSDIEIAELLKNIAAVMDASLNSGGSTMATYVRADGSKGNYLELFAQVFRREGQPCPVCGTEIIKTRVAGRGTHTCPHCQPDPATKPTRSHA